jgi:hypothetical protein
MTDYAQGSGSGAMAPGQGKTNAVRLRPNALDVQDRQALCFTICKCNTMPPVGSKGQMLKQQCVSGRLKTADALANYQSPYKAEVNYDMSQDPPAPIMERRIVTKAHDYLPGWIQKYWPGGLKDYTPGIGNIRRPDVVIVKNASQPPTQDNLKNVVEIKFPPDAVDLKQQAAYEEIAGEPNKVVTMGPSDCECSGKENAQTESSSAPSFSSQLGKLFSQGLSNYLHGGPPAPPLPLPIP